jgi:hypothetical protein
LWSRDVPFKTGFTVLSTFRILEKVKKKERRRRRRKKKKKRKMTLC